MSGFKVPGSLTVTKQSLDSVADHKLVQDVLAQEFTAVRAAATRARLSPTSFSVCMTSTRRSRIRPLVLVARMMQGMAEINLDSASFAGAVTRKLPSASGISVPAGLISAKDTDSSLISTFAVALSLSADDQGAMTAAASISGADAVSSATAENLLNAQVVRFMKPSASAPSVGASDDDVLTATLSAAELASDYSAELAALEAQYTIGDLIANWRITVPAITLGVDSILSQHARANTKDSAAVFASDELMVMATAASYGISVDDYEGNATEIVGSDNVFAVLKQE